MPADRERAALRKQRWLEAQTAEGQAWKKFKSCELCGESFIVNNWPDRRARTPRLQGRIVCPWCQSRKGKLRITEHILVEKLMKQPCLEQFPDCGRCLSCIARRVLGRTVNT